MCRASESTLRVESLDLRSRPALWFLIPHHAGLFITNKSSEGCTALGDGSSKLEKPRTFGAA